jgi:Ca2+-binding EF-hand superfamily protein
MSMRNYLLALALAGTAISGIAVAGQDNGGGMRADANKDRTVTRAEFMARSDQRFARLDANGDGVISGDELPGRGRLVAGADADKDGKITKAEYSAQAAARFAKLDANGDGKISSDEMKAMGERMREGRGGRGGGGMMPPPGAPGRHGGHGDMLARIDTNKDGKISREEMRARIDARFDKLDTNKDGVIDQAEMQAARGKMKEHMGRMGGHWRHRPGGPGMPPTGADAPKPDAGQ